MRNHWLNNRLSLWLIDDGEQHWYSASSAVEALKLHEDLGCELENDAIVTKQADDKSLTVNMDDCSYDYPITKTALEWCSEGKGFIASSVW